MAYKQTLTLRVSPFVKDSVKALAEKDGRTVSQVGFILLAEALERRKRNAKLINKG